MHATTESAAKNFFILDAALGMDKNNEQAKKMKRVSRLLVDAQTSILRCFQTSFFLNFAFSASSIMTVCWQRVLFE